MAKKPKHHSKVQKTHHKSDEETHHEHKDHERHEKVHEKKKAHKTKQKPNQAKFWIVGILVLIGLFWLFSTMNNSDSDGSSGTFDDSAATTGAGQAKLDFYVMSQCPYGTQVEDAIKPVLDKLGNAVDFELNYIVSAEGDNFKSLHGPAEISGDMIQLCAAKYDPDKYMDLVVCMNKDARSIPNNWEACADESGLDKESIKKCYEGDEGKQLLTESMKKSQEVRASGSPTMYLNGKPYNGGRDTTSFLRAICSNLKDHPGCEDIPACGSDAECTAQPDKIGTCKNPGQDDAECVYTDPVSFEVIVLNDKRCSSCDVSRIIATTEQLFKGAKHRTVDVSSEEGKKIVEDLGLTVVPVFIFDKDVEKTKTWTDTPRIRDAFEPAGDKYRLKDAVTKASYYIDEEKRNQYLKSIGVVKGDNKPQIDFYVMSYCPYGNQAEEGIAPVYDLLGDKADFKPHYVIYENYRGGGPSYCFDDENKYCSMHGIQELHQDIREMCAYKHLGTKAWFDFALAMNKDCNANNADSCWEGVADKIGLDKKVITDCFDTEALDILKEEKSLNKLMGVSGSPTVFIEGDQYSGARDPDSFRKALCAGYETPPVECGTQLTATNKPASAPSAGSCS